MMTMTGLAFMLNTQSRSSSGRPAIFTKFENITAPITKKNNIDVVFAVLINILNVLETVSFRLTKAIKKAPIAPIPAASVGVKTPT